jgi:hypothetical protein
MVGHGYSFCYDPASTARTSHGVWSCLCHDFQVRLSKKLDELTTSRHPDELYINGIQRESFLPAIQLIKDRFEVVDLNSPTGQSFIIMELNSRLSKNAPSPLKSLLRPPRYSKPPRTPEDIHFPSINRPSLFRYSNKREIKIMGKGTCCSGMLGEYSQIPVFGSV